MPKHGVILGEEIIEIPDEIWTWTLPGAQGPVRGDVDTPAGEVRLMGIRRSDFTVELDEIAYDTGDGPDILTLQIRGCKPELGMIIQIWRPSSADWISTPEIWIVDGISEHRSTAACSILSLRDRGYEEVRGWEIERNQTYQEYIAQRAAEDADRRILALQRAFELQTGITGMTREEQLQWLGRIGAREVPPPPVGPGAVIDV